MCEHICHKDINWTRLFCGALGWFVWQWATPSLCVKLQLSDSIHQPELTNEEFYRAKNLGKEGRLFSQPAAQEDDAINKHSLDPTFTAGIRVNTTCLVRPHDELGQRNGSPCTPTAPNSQKVSDLIHLKSSVGATFLMTDTKWQKKKTSLKT